METGEAEIETARREIGEETGKRAEPRPMNLVQSFMIESQYLATRLASPIIARETAFSAEIDSSAPIRIDPSEHDDWGWFTLAETYEKIRWTDDREAIERFAARLSQNGTVPRLNAAAE